MKRYYVDLQLNTRDIGGYHTMYQRKIPEGVFIRSDVPQYLTKEGRDFFVNLGVSTVIDFRTHDIAARYPSVFESDPRFVYRRFPIVEGSLAAPSTPDQSPFTYLRMLSHEDTFKAIFDTILGAPGSVFYHCTAGKDRTGVVTFLLLDLAGVEEHDIVMDYAVSEQFINAKINDLRALHPDFPISLGYSKPHYMEQFIQLFREKYGSARHYLRHIGVTDDELTHLLKKLGQID